LHCISKCCSEHVLASHGILRQTELVERRKLLDFQLLVVGKWD
jgi:hypothetical protein